MAARNDITGGRLSVREMTYSVKLNGNSQYISTGTPIYQTGGASYEMWIKTPGQPDTTNETLFSEGNTGSNNPFLRVKYQAANDNIIQVGNRDDVAGVTNFINFSNVPLPHGKWCHLVLTDDGSTNMVLYVNNEANAQTYSALGTTTLDTGGIGSLVRGTPAFFGKLNVATFRKYNTVLTQGEVDGLYYNDEVPISCIQEFKFDDGVGTTVTDSVGSDDGTITGGASWTQDTPFRARNSVIVGRSDILTARTDV